MLTPLATYEVKLETYRFNGKDFTIRSLEDRQQFSDVGGVAEAAGISSATWSLFGNVWPSGLILADLMCTLDLKGLRILELGCGLGIASLIAQSRGASITATDYHPLAKTFLDENSRLNNLDHVPFIACDWALPMLEMGYFDLIIGSDLLYEPNHAELLSNFINGHSSDPGRVIIIDPDRTEQSKFTRRMVEHGFDASKARSTQAQKDDRGFKGKTLTYRRTEEG